MIVIPMGTDAPIYHWPYATVGMILLNVVLIFVIPPSRTTRNPTRTTRWWPNRSSLSQLLDRYALALGDGLHHPVQWLTHNFLHYGFLHLAGTLLFLWAFGIVVEGKLGALKYLATYLAIGTLHGAFVQILLLRSGLDGHAAGASAVVYGLLAVCMIWAPRNELNCTIILPIGFRILVFHREFYYTTVALFYLGGQILGLVFWGGFAGQIMISEMGHLSGALWGSVIAILILKLGLVDCEGWDAFSLWAKHRELGRQWKARGERLDREKENSKASIRHAMKALKKKERNAETDQPSLEERAAVAVRRRSGNWSRPATSTPRSWLMTRPVETSPTGRRRSTFLPSSRPSTPGERSSIRSG